MTAIESLVVRTLSAAAEIPRLERMWLALYELQREQGMKMSPPPDAFARWTASMAPSLGRFAQLFVAEGDGELHGFLAARVRRAPPWFGDMAIGFVSEVWVEPDVRGQRLGERLVRAAEEWFRSQEIERAELQVMPRNAAARALYRRLGWQDEVLQMTRQPL